MATIAGRLFTSACGFHVHCHAAIVYPLNPCSTIVLGGSDYPRSAPTFLEAIHVYGLRVRH